MAGDVAPWLAVRIEPAGDSVAIVSALFAFGSQGVQEEGGALITHFPPGTNALDVEYAVRAVDPLAQIRMSDARHMVWDEWRAAVGSHRLGKVSIAPPWLADLGDPMQVVIDPAMAFGTGEHATTRGVVRLMQQLQPMPRVVADVGAGSAVLAICAARLGASRVVAIELDPDAIGNAEQNIAVNRVDNIVHMIEGDAALLLPLLAPLELVLANIASSVLVEMLGVIHDSLVPRGHAILSGILIDEKHRMLAGIGDDSWRVVSEDEEEEWWSVLIERRR